jgi:hypothetical protein
VDKRNRLPEEIKQVQQARRTSERVKEIEKFETVMAQRIDSRDTS